tara:strand:- start:3174 stop:4229 length:1056 start_codon:yes stop_codon:yes gene_type:complete
MQRLIGKMYRSILERIIVAFPVSNVNKQLDIPTKILISNGAHLGDLVNATTLCHALKKAVPHIDIGVLCGSWAKVVPIHHPAVNRVHIVDHWKHNRSHASFFKKVYEFLHTFWVARREINREHYDMVIDTYCYYPNMSIPLYFTNIPTRMGFSSGGCGSLYHVNHPVGLPFEHHMLDYLNQLIQSKLCLELEWGSNPLVDGIQETAMDNPYVCIHPSSNNPLFSWAIDDWVAVVHNLHQQGRSVVITGFGDKDQQVADAILEACPRVNSLVNQLDWREFVLMIKSADLVISVETVAVHIAALNHVKLIALYFGQSQENFWRPFGSNVELLSPINQVNAEMVIQKVMAFYDG